MPTATSAPSLTAAILDDVCVALEHLLLFAKNHTTERTRHIGGGDPDSARALGAVLFYIAALSAEPLDKRQRATVEALGVRAVALAANAGVNVAKSAYDVLAAAGHRLSDDAATWARFTYRQSIPVDRVALADASRQRLLEATELERQASILEAAENERAAIADRISTMRRQAALLRQESADLLN
jgi:hypothetical protein